MLDIFTDCIRLKYGKRLSNYAIIIIIQNFNKLLTKNLKLTLTHSLSTKTKIA